MQFFILSLFQKVWRDFTQLPPLPSGRDQIWEIAAQFWKVLRMCRLGAHDGKLLFNMLFCHACFWESAADQVPPSAPLCSDSYSSIRKSVWSKQWQILPCWGQGGSKVVKIWPCTGGNYLPTSRVPHPVEKHKSLSTLPKAWQGQCSLAVQSEGFATEPISPRQNYMGDSGRRRGMTPESRGALFSQSHGT